MRIWLAVISLALAIAAAIYALTAPTYAAFGPDGRPMRYETLMQFNGIWVLVPAFFPVAIAAVPLIYRRQILRIIAAVVLLVFTVIAGMSIGLYYGPAGIAMALAGCFSDPNSSTRI